MADSMVAYIDIYQKAKKSIYAVYACLNYGEAYCPEEIAAQAICIEDDIAKVIDQL